MIAMTKIKPESFKVIDKMCSTCNSSLEYANTCFGSGSKVSYLHRCKNGHEVFANDKYPILTFSAGLRDFFVPIESVISVDPKDLKWS